MLNIKTGQATNVAVYQRRFEECRSDRFRRCKQYHQVLKFVSTTPIPINRIMHSEMRAMGNSEFKNHRGVLPVDSLIHRMCVLQHSSCSCPNRR